MSAENPIWRAGDSGKGAFHPDEWTRLAPDAPLPGGDVALLVPLKDFLADASRFLARNGALAVEVAPGEAVDALAPYLHRLSMTALSFPKFSDGRAYSTARLLRERMGYTGDLRAVGDVLADQIPLMRRCGITSFAVSHKPTRAALEAGRLAEMHHFYQPVPTAPREAPAGTRPWLRQPAN
jgi:phosphoadenosine phosphosulfate reductase